MEKCLGGILKASCENFNRRRSRKRTIKEKSVRRVLVENNFEVTLMICHGEEKQKS